MANNPAPKSNKAKCPYCGDASTNHALSYAHDIVTMLTEPYINFFATTSPHFIKISAKAFLNLLSKLLILSRVITFDTDIEKVLSFRSRVIWEEAKRRGLPLEQMFVIKRPTEHFRVKTNGKYVYFESLPIPPRLEKDGDRKWDNKYYLKRQLILQGIPVPNFQNISFFKRYNLDEIFNTLQKPVIVKPAAGSRGRHTTTNIHTLEGFKKAVSVGRKLSPSLIVEEHIFGYVCRATLVDGKLVGFYRAESPYVIGDGKQTIDELIKERDTNRPERVSAIHVSTELVETIGRHGYALDSVLPEGKKIFLYHRTGRFFGGHTREMLTELHPSFVPILEKAAQITTLPVVGFDVIVPDPSVEQSTQRWGIIECNTLPYIDLHYYALEGGPSNVAGKIWDLWK